MTDNRVPKQMVKVTERRSVRYTSAEPADIWADVVARDLRDMQRLSAAMMELAIQTIPFAVFNVLAELFYSCIYRRWGRYVPESDYLADQSGILSRAQLAFLQRQYTLLHVFCSTLTVWDREREEMVCMRSLDWAGATEIAGCSRIFEFVDEHGSTTARVAGIAGMLGVLTGVKKGFSVVINYAPWHYSAQFGTDPTFLLRELLENRAIDTFAGAVDTVRSWQVGAPCFITICGVRPGDQIVVEFGKGGKTHIRPGSADGLLVQTNQYAADSLFADKNLRFYAEEPGIGWYQSDLMLNSDQRRRQIEAAGAQIRSTSEPLTDKLQEIFAQPPVMNFKTAQWVLMRPQDGSIELWACSPC